LLKIYIFTNLAILSKKLGSNLIRDHRERDDINPGLKVKIVLKKDQRSGKLTIGVVQKLLTSSKYHPRGIKVMLEDGQVGRVQEFV
jgi:uncharacterized repeat protein (TIGR03833 family)